ncbi:hypothetical protein DFR67_103169 [Williamsia limnetica]|uniref:Uncharacterized protein n=1 Tax=Williamsia limnetica TaxID=882452 RepID=A0A318RTG1_WILLI|nr:hypothetical protein DFR67_103169 [Williamsia limnetica]
MAGRRSQVVHSWTCVAASPATESGEHGENAKLTVGNVRASGRCKPRQFLERILSGGAAALNVI